ncbi:MAG: metal ABC transporter permease [Planctomycetes bacterium]|jgi:zinc transport system permease protein|nr:metal ABC transporter permease [Planctomycetota bacterium]
MGLFSFLQYGFIQNAYLAGFFVAIICSVLGLFLVLRKLSLIGDGLSHVSFGAVALGLFLGFYPFYVAIPLAIIGSLFILRLTEKVKIYGDAAIGMVSALGVASGVILVSVSKGFNVDLFSYLFGNILTIGTKEIILSILLAILVFILLGIFYKDFLVVTFDKEYALASGINVKRVNIILAVLTALTVVLAIKIVGVMLVSALLILPAVTGLQNATSFRSALITSALMAILSVLGGITLAFFLDWPAGATIVVINFVLFVISFIVKKLGK